MDTCTKRAWLHNAAAAAKNAVGQLMARDEWGSFSHCMGLEIAAKLNMTSGWAEAKHRSHDAASIKLRSIGAAWSRVSHAAAALWYAHVTS